ncbi:MAG: zonular occludens toxin domain-containing protein [Defluviitaleaceae bacterium]|nr:zonular occludens toxin domain-containing protein [Defluviitaleaceae bacterium]MCL2262752.1 zonular occludens toxin domain-containing protein [Defluviitaleaceae bacterium]
MIKVYTGGPGNGKSVHMARDIHDALLRGQNVISTVPINIDVISKDGAKPIGDYIRISIQDITPEHLYMYMVNMHEKDKEGQTLVFLDECQVIFNSREWNQPGRKDWLWFFQSHRHLGFNIYLLTQHSSFLDKVIVKLIEIEVKHRKVSNLLWWFPVTLFVHREEWAAIKSTNNKISTSFMFGRAFLFKIYDSYTIFTEVLEKYAHLKRDDWREVITTKIDQV